MKGGEYWVIHGVVRESKKNTRLLEVLSMPMGHEIAWGPFFRRVPMY